MSERTPQTPSPPENRALTSVLRGESPRDSPEATEKLDQALRVSVLIAPVAASGEDAEAQLDLVGTVDEEGNSALLAFADARALGLWSSEHAFVAVRAPDLCATVLDRGLHALAIDVAGPARLTLGADALRRCAQAGGC
ncbi:MAG: SseB family protein [Thermoleophilaceae bacterium]